MKPLLFVKIFIFLIHSITKRPKIKQNSRTLNRVGMLEDKNVSPV